MITTKFRLSPTNTTTGINNIDISSYQDILLLKTLKTWFYFVIKYEWLNKIKFRKIILRE